MINENQDLLKGKELISAALSRLDKGKITYIPSEMKSAKQQRKIQDIVNQITDKAAGVNDLMNFGEEKLIRSLYSYTRGNVHYAIRNEESFTDEEVINDIADYLAEKAYLECARKLLNTNRLDSWICDARIRLV